MPFSLPKMRRWRRHCAAFLSTAISRNRYFRSFLTAPRFYVRTCSERRLRSYIIYRFRFSKSIVPINFAAEAFICYRISRVIFMNRAYGNNIIGSEYRYLQFRRKILLLFDCFFCDGFIQNCRLLSNFYR